MKRSSWFAAALALSIGAATAMAQTASPQAPPTAPGDCPCMAAAAKAGAAAEPCPCTSGTGPMAAMHEKMHGPSGQMPQAGMQGHMMGAGMMGEIVARAKAEIKGEGITGTAEFIEHKAANADKLAAGAWTGNPVEVVVDVKGLKPGLHGMHLHAIGKCEPDFGAAGGHFDPGPNSNTDPDANHPFHMGDLPNLLADEQGHAAIHAWTSRVSLSPGPVSVFDADGTAIIVHANPDQGITGEPKSGVAGGARVACGVLAKQ